MAFLAAAVAVAATACGDDDDSDDGRTGGAGGKGGSAGSQAAGGEGGDSGGSAGKGGTGGTTATGGAGGESGSGTVDTGGAGGTAGSGDAGSGNEGGGGAGGDECSVPASFGDAGSVPGTAYTEFGADVSWFGPLEPGDPADGLWVELYAGAGIFENGLTTISNYTLAGDDLTTANCNACIYITDRQDLNDGTVWEDTYFVTGGVLNLTSVEGNITGTVTNATFKKVDWNSGAWIEDGCLSAIDSISFNAAIPE